MSSATDMASRHSSEHPVISDRLRSEIASHLLANMPEPDIIRLLQKQNLTEATIKAEIAIARGSPYFQAAQAMAQQMAKQESVADILHSLRELDSGNNTIERRHNLSRKEFLEKYYSKNRPVILCGLMDDWRAMTRWTPDYLKSVCGNEIVDVSYKRNDNPLFEIEAEKHLHKMTFAEYVDMVARSHETNDFYITARNGFFTRPGTKRLLDDIDTFTEYLEPNSKTGAHFWYGPKGTVTPLHHDALNILLAQVQGRKRIKMIPMSEQPYMYNHMAVYTLIDAEAPDYERFPKYKKAQIIELDLMPGEVLFIPIGWWHHVRALDASISLSFTQFVFPNNFKWSHPSIQGRKNADAYDSYAANDKVQTSSAMSSQKNTVETLDVAKQSPKTSPGPLASEDSTKVINHEWESWIQLNLNRKCDPKGIYDILRKNEYPIAEIRRAMGAAFPADAIAPEAAREIKHMTTAPEKRTAYKQQLDMGWLGWLDQNIARQCTPESILETLLKNSFSIPAIRKAMGSSFPAESKLLSAYPKDDPIWHEQVTPGIDHKALATIPEARLLKLPHAEKLGTDKAQIIVLKHFLSDEECDKIMAIMQTSLRPSTVTVYVEGFRTSMTCDLCKLENPFIKKIDDKIASTIGIHVSYSEGIQAQKYSVGQEFKSHTDAFKPGTREYEAHARERGNRTWTFMIYLDETPKGGGTHFEKLQKTFYPQKGMAVIWNNLYSDGIPNPDTLHWGMPVEEGEKHIITKWFREKGKGPLFFED